MCSLTCATCDPLFAMPVGADADGSPQHPYLRSGTQGFFEASMTSGDHSDEEGEQIQVRNLPHDWI